MLKRIDKYLKALDEQTSEKEKEEEIKTKKETELKEEYAPRECTKEEAAQLRELLISLRWRPYLEYYRANINDWERLKAQILKIPVKRQVELFEQLRITEVGTKIQIPVSSWQVIKELATGGGEGR